MTSLLLFLVGVSFFYLWYRFSDDESGKAISTAQRRQQLLAGSVFCLLGIIDFIVAPMAEMIPLLIRLFAGIFLFLMAGKASRQVATAIYYLTAVLILIRGLLEFIGL